MAVEVGEGASEAMGDGGTRVGARVTEGIGKGVIDGIGWGAQAASKITRRMRNPRPEILMNISGISFAFGVL